ncbi:DUF2955 domain-containing protein, partial [Enterobacter intestinihominis]
MSSIWGVVGVVVGFIYFVLFLFFVYYHCSILVLLLRVRGGGVAFGAPGHVRETGGAGGRFSSITTIGIMFGQNM